MKRVKRQLRNAAREARTEVYRQHILAAAEAVFAERGFEAATLQEIGAKVGLSMGTIYSVFPSKAELLQAILELRGSAILQLVREVVAREASAIETLKALAREYVRFFVEHPAFLQMHLRQGSSWVLRPTNGGGSRAEVWSEIHGLQAGVFRRGVADGTFVKEDPEFLAKLFSALDQVVLADWVGSGMQAAPGTLIKRLDEIVERLFCKRR